MADTKVEDLKTALIGAMTVVAPGALPIAKEKPKSFDEGDMTGTEDVEGEEVEPPRLGIAQALSYQMQRSRPEYIKDLRVGEIFNSKTGKIYGGGPLTFIPLKKGIRRIEYDPTQRGVIKTMDVPVHDIRNEWTPQENGKSLPPKATKYFEYVVLLCQPGERPKQEDVVVISVACTNRQSTAAGEGLLREIKAYPRHAIYSHFYTAGVKEVSNDKGTWNIWTFEKAGFVGTDTEYGQLLHETAKNLALEWRDRDMPIPVQEDDSFDVKKLEDEEGM